MKKTDISITALTEAKNIYTNRLCKLLENELYEGIKSIWLTCKKEKNCLKQFQKKLESVPTWNTLILDDEIKRIKSKIKYDYFDKLIDAIFITNAKILTSISNSKVKVKVNIPTTTKFIHHCYISLAYNLYTDPYLIDDRIKNYQELQTNFKTLMSMIKLSIKETIENLLPMDDLLDSCLVDNIASDTDNDDEDLENEQEGYKEENGDEEENNYIPNLNVSDGNTISEVVDNYYKENIEEDKEDSKYTEQQELQENSNEEIEENEKDYEDGEEKEEENEEENNLVINLSDYNINDNHKQEEKEQQYDLPQQNRKTPEIPTFFD